MDKEELRRRLKEELDRRTCSGHPHRKYKNYLNRFTNEPSWQQHLDDALMDPDLQEIFVIAANSCGKSFKIARLIVEILNNEHPFCENFPDTPVWVHCIVKDTGTLKTTIQNHLETITDYEISGIPEMSNSKKYKLHVHGGIIRDILHKETRNKVTFGYASKGAEGNVGVRPHLLLSDEPFREDLYNEMVVRTTTNKSKFCMLATAIEAKHAWVMLRASNAIENPSKSRKVIQAAMYDSPYVDQAKIEHFKRTFGEDTPQYRIRVHGSLEIASGIVFEGIEQCLVCNNYVPEVYKELDGRQQERHFIWAESMDFGISAKDPFLYTVFKLWDNGEIVQEDEICLYGESCAVWADKIHEIRNKLDMPFYSNAMNGIQSVDSWLEPEINPENGRVRNVYKGTGIIVRTPQICVGDKQYLARKVSMAASSRLKGYFANRKIFISPSKADKIETSLPLVQDLIKGMIFKIKQHCVFSYKFARSYITRYNEETGSIQYDSPHDHWSDCMRYLVERLGNSNAHVKNMIQMREFNKNASLNSIIKNDINKHRRL